MKPDYYTEQTIGTASGPAPYEVPDPDWTPKQLENWEQHGLHVYKRLETDVGRYWYRRCWRPKKQYEGMMKRDHVTFGDPEDYVIEEVEDTLQPMGDVTAVLMRKLHGYDDREELEDAAADIVRAKLRNIKETDPERARQLLARADRVSQLYGLNGGD